MRVAQEAAAGKEWREARGEARAGECNGRGRTWATGGDVAEAVRSTARVAAAIIDCHWHSRRGSRERASALLVMVMLQLAIAAALYGLAYLICSFIAEMFPAGLPSRVPNLLERRPGSVGGRVLFLISCMACTGNAFVVEVFSSVTFPPPSGAPVCANSLGNSSALSGYAGICNVGSGGVGGLALDSCDGKTSLTLALFTPANFNETWSTSSGLCTTQRNVTAALTLNTCTLVTFKPCSTCPFVQQGWMLRDATCATAPVNPPYMYVRIAREDCNRPIQLNLPSTFFYQKGFVFDDCTDIDPSVWPALPQPSLPTGDPPRRGVVVNPGSPNIFRGTWLTFNRLTARFEILPGGDCNTAGGRSSWSTTGSINNIASEAESSICLEGDDYPLAWRFFLPPLFPTVFASSPSPSLAPQPPSQSLSNEVKAIIGVGVGSFFLLCVFGAILAYAVYNLRRLMNQRTPSPPEHIAEWGKPAVELAKTQRVGNPLNQTN